MNIQTFAGNQNLPCRPRGVWSCRSVSVRLTSCHVSNKHTLSSQLWESPARKRRRMWKDMMMNTFTLTHMQGWGLCNLLIYFYIKSDYWLIIATFKKTNWGCMIPAWAIRIISQKVVYTAINGSLRCLHSCNSLMNWTQITLRKCCNKRICREERETLHPEVFVKKSHCYCNIKLCYRRFSWCCAALRAQNLDN